MTTPKNLKGTASPEPHGLGSALLGAGIKITLVVLIVGGAVLLYRHQMATSPQAKRQKPPRQAKLVQVMPLRKADCTTSVPVNGSVVPAQQVTLHPQVAGQIVELSEALIPGGVVHAGDKLIAIDPRDYDILVQQRQSDVARVLKDLKVEQGNQAVARQEYELLGEVIAEEDQELVLREPHLASAESALESTQAALLKATLDRARCDISAPFNAVIQQKHIDLGATVSANSQLVTLIATDEAWVELKVPIHQLKWLTIPQSNGDPGSTVKITNELAWGPDQFRTGRVVRLYGELETAGMMAQLLVVVEDPFSLRPENRDKPKLLMGSYVSAEIQGRTLPSVFPIKRPYVHDNAVWIMDGNAQLEIRPVKIVFPGIDEVFVSQGLAENEPLVITDIAAPVSGMPLRIAEASDDTTEKDLQVARNDGEPQ